jgi:hypothetical protein
MTRGKWFAFAIVSSLVMGSAWAADLRLVLERGEAYTFVKSQTFGKLEMTPHVAAWIEDAKGNFAKTIYVSLKNGKQDFWVGRRVHPLPVWDARHLGEKIVDAVGGASPAPKSPALLEWRASIPSNLAASGYSVWLEANIGFDYNAAFPEDGKEIWGQPSILLKADVPSGARPGSEIALAPVGRSIGANGELSKGLEGISSALKLFSKAAARIE